MKNTPKIGRIYHVVDKTTGETVKVGSTVLSLSKRWSSYDKQKYPNHFLREVRVMESSDLDWFEPKNRLSPFMWHLVAAEHIEIIRQGTFRNNKLSNQHSPLDQKSRGFDALEVSTEAGKLGGAARVAMGDWKEVSAKGRAIAWKNNKVNPAVAEQGRAQGRKNVESGLWESFQTSEYKALAGRISAIKKHALKNEEGKSINAVKMGGVGGKRGGVAANHLRWHIKRGIVNPSCPLCKS